MSFLVAEKEEYHPLNPNNEGEDEELTIPCSDAVIIWRRRFNILLVSSLCFISFLTGGFIYRLSTFSCPSPKPGVRVPYSPAPVTYVNKWLTGDPDTPKFMGQPRAEMDHAWHDLLSATSIRFSEEELLLAENASSIRHKDGGYVGGLGISHSLHCVKRIKQYMHPEYYYQGDQAWEELFLHADHCLESLRQVVLCSADVSPYTLEWTPHSRYKPAVRVPQAHACVNWEALHEWMSARAASLDDVVGPPESLYENIEPESNHHLVD
ncbi:hypothetical protein F5Y13DRAFT_196625 [Hypoxylon sp. FL1857]|nr:hypothetical protein F5Y13DRAFT_196625 [Hypoxylon sp. FL1857]